MRCQVRNVTWVILIFKLKLEKNKGRNKLNAHKNINKGIYTQEK